MGEEEILPPEQPLPGGEAITPQQDTTGMPAETPVEPLQTTAMEVHHPHHVHHKKKWKDYLFEFFMLTLAVSAGFFVENLREHYVEHERANEYASMLHQDLVNDTLIMNIIIDFRNAQAKKYDTLRHMIDSVPFSKMDKIKFARLVYSVGDTRHFLVNNSTYQQLKSSGSLRYFKDTALIRLLSTYEEDIKHGEFIQEEEKQLSSAQIMPFKLQHLNMKLTEGNATAAINENFPSDLLIDFDRKTMMELYNLVRISAWYNSFLSKPVFDPYKQKAAHIINLLQEEYHLNE